MMKFVWLIVTLSLAGWINKLDGVIVKRSSSGDVLTDFGEDRLTKEVFARYQYAVLYRDGFLKIHIDNVTKSFREIENTDIILSLKHNETNKFMSTSFSDVTEPIIKKKMTARLNNGSVIIRTDYPEDPKDQEQSSVMSLQNEQRIFEQVKQSKDDYVMSEVDDDDLFRRIKHDLSRMETELKSKMLIEGKLIRFFKIDGLCIKVEYDPDTNQRYRYTLKCSRINCKLVPRSSKRSLSPSVELEESSEWVGTVLNRKKRSETSDDDTLDVILRIIRNTTITNWASGKARSMSKAVVVSKLNTFLHWNKFCKGGDNKALMKRDKCISLEISYNLANQCLRIPHCRSDVSTFASDGVSCISEESSVCPYSLTMVHKIMECSTDKDMVMAVLDDIRKELELNYCLITLLDTGEVAGRRCGEGKRVTVDLSVMLIKGADVSFYTLPQAIRKVHDPRTIESYNCSSTCKDGSCRGDEIYLENFRGGDDSEFCTFNTNYFYYSMSYKNRNYPLSCYAEHRVRAELLSDDIPDESSLLDKSSFSCSNGFLDYNTQGVTIAMISVCSNRTCAHKKSLIGEGSLRMPNNFFITVTQVKVTMHLPQHRGSKVISLSCQQAEICDINPCFFCMERWVSYHCFGFIEWLVYLTVLLLILVAFMFILRCLILVTLVTCKTLNPLRVFCFWTCYKCKNSVKTGTSYTQNVISQMSIEMEDTKPLLKEDQSKEKVRKPKYVSRTFILNVVVIILLLPVVLGFDSCEHHASFTINQNDCPEGFCSISDSSRVVLASKGSTSCFRFEEQNKIVAESIQIKTISVGLSCDSEVLYHHPKASVLCKSRHNCRSVGLCTEEKCENVKTSDSVSGFEDQNNQAGLSGCDKVCGCAGCGCFYCTQSCLFYRAYFVNLERKTYEVKKCIRWVYFTDIEVTTVSIKETKTERTRLTPGSTSKILGIDLTLVSLTDVPSDLISYCFMVADGKASLTKCNERGKVVKGQIGEIQCPSHDVSLTVSSSCNFDPTLITVRTTVDSAKCDAYLLNPEKVFKDKPLPFMSSDGVLTYESGRLINEIRDGFSLELQLDFHNHGVSVVYDKAMCFVDFVKLEGCYSCLEGSVVIIKGKTNHGGSIANINCPSLKTPITESFTNIAEELKVRANFVRSSINELCTVTCSGGNSTFRIKGDLIYVPATPLAKDDSFIDFDHHSSSFDIWSLFQSNWFITIASVLVILIVVLILVFFAKMLFKDKRG